jgi:hypothetical protein
VGAVSARHTPAQVLEWTLPIGHASADLVTSSSTSSSSSSSASSSAAAPSVLTGATAAAARMLAALDANPTARWRFDLDGRRLSALARRALPTHLGLHHHGADAADGIEAAIRGCSAGSGSAGSGIAGTESGAGDAGYTQAELLHLTRSALPAQAAGAWRVLARVWTAARGGRLVIVKRQHRASASDASESSASSASSASSSSSLSSSLSSASSLPSSGMVESRISPGYGAAVWAYAIEGGALLLALRTLGAGAAIDGRSVGSGTWGSDGEGRQLPQIKWRECFLNHCPFRKTNIAIVCK